LDRIRNALKRKKRRKLFVPPYIHHVLDYIHFDRFFRDVDLILLLPAHVRDEVLERPPLVTFKLVKTLGRKLFNHTHLSRYTIQELQDIAQGPCACNQAVYKDFIHPSYHHVVTADLSIIANKEVRHLLSLGTKYRWDDGGITDLSKVADRVKDALDLYIHKLATSTGTDDTQFEEWKYSFMQRVENAIDVYASSTRPPPEAPTLGKQGSRYLQYLKHHFIFTYIDKSANDFAIQCRKHYVQDLLREVNDNGTYVPVDSSMEDVVQEHQSWLQSEGIIQQDDKLENKLPYLYIAPKFHKVGKRYIAGSKGASLESLSLRVTQALKALAGDVDDLWISTLDKVGIKASSSWIITDSAQVPQLVRKLNTYVHTEQDTHAQDISTHDFSTLYTNIHLKDLGDRLTTLVNRLFARRRKKSRKRHKFLCITGDDVRWDSEGKESHNTICFDEKKLTSWIRYLIHNTYVTVGNQLYKQVIGIPMGTNAAVFLANYFLFTYEHAFIEKLIEDEDLQTLYDFLHTGRYIDDVLVMHNPSFLKHMHTLYPQDMLTLNLEQQGFDVHFLDVRIYRPRRNRVRYSTKVYDKRTDKKLRHLPHTKFPHIQSFIPSRFKYNIIISQTWRFARRCQSIKSFVYNVACLLRDLSIKRYILTRLIRLLSGLFKMHPSMRKGLSVKHLLKRILARYKQLR
jgi:hypothetical protein